LRIEELAKAKEEAFLELVISENTELLVWASLIPILCAARKVTIKQAAEEIHGVSYRRLLALSKGRVKGLEHGEAIALLQYFGGAIVHLRFVGRLSRVEVDRRGAN
jgi:hypothetical protein